jgi:hypothetical protein
MTHKEISGIILLALCVLLPYLLLLYKEYRLAVKLIIVSAIMLFVDILFISISLFANFPLLQIFCFYYNLCIWPLIFVNFGIALSTWESTKEE